MIPEKEERHYAWDLLPAHTEGKLSLHLVVKTATSILIFLEVVDTRVKETVQTHVRWHDSLDNQLRRI